MNPESLAERQLEDYDRHQPGRLFADDTFILTEAEAYHLQLAVAALRERRGECVAGYKIGCVSEAVRSQLGLADPVFGHVFSSELHISGCILDHTVYAGLAVEGEWAVRIAEDIPGRGWLERNLQSAIASVFPVIELHNYVLRGRAQVAQELIANNAIHAGVVLPAREGAAADRSNPESPIVVSVNGEIKGTSAEMALDQAASGLACLVERLERFGIHLKSGQIALTGSPLPLYRVEAGDAVEVRCGRLAEVTATIG